jgi:hypothetical protein
MHILLKKSFFQIIFFAALLGVAWAQYGQQGGQHGYNHGHAVSSQSFVKHESPVHHKKVVVPVVPVIPVHQVSAPAQHHHHEQHGHAVSSQSFVSHHSQSHHQAPAHHQEHHAPVHHAPMHYAKHEEEHVRLIRMNSF